MIFKIIALPFVLIKNLLRLILGVVKTVVMMFVGILRFITGRVFGTLFGGLIGLFFGSNHIGIRLFKRKKAVKPVKKE